MFSIRFTALSLRLPVRTAIALAALAWLTSQPAYSAPTMTEEQLTGLVKTAGARVTATNISVFGTGPEVTVLAEKSTSASDRDLKVDAIFLAKSLIDGSNGQVETVKVLFSQPDKPGRYVMVDKKIVEDYGSRKLTPEQLLTALTLTPLDAQKTKDVVSGPFQDRRRVVLRRIENLRKNGTGVTAFEQLFDKLEKSVQSSESPEAIVQNLSFIETKLSDQEKLVKQAKISSQGYHAKGTHGSSSSPPPSSGSSPPATATITPPQGQGRPMNMPMPWGHGGGSINFPMPPPPPPGQGGPGFPGGGPPP